MKYVEKDDFDLELNYIDDEIKLLFTQIASSILGDSICQGQIFCKKMYWHLFY